MLQYPVRHGLQSERRNGLFDLSVFCNQTRLTGLEQMIELRHKDDGVIFVAAFFQSCLNPSQVLFGNRLEVLFTVNRKYRSALT